MKSRVVQPIHKNEKAGQRTEPLPLDYKRAKRRGFLTKCRLIWSKIIIRDSQYVDYNLMLVLVFLMCFGLIMLYSTSAYSARLDFENDDMHYFIRQAAFGILSFIGMLIVSKIDYHYYGPFSIYFYIIALILMGLVQTPLGMTISGARRWLRLPGGQTLQPSEIMKIAMILFVAYEICRYGKDAQKISGTIRILAIGFIGFLGVFLLTDNLSTAIIVFLIVCTMYFVIHPNTWVFVTLAALAVSSVAVARYYLSSMDLTLFSDDFRLQRILTWLDVENHAQGDGFQVLQGLYAIGSGGFFGKGLGNSTQKLGILPEVENDMILPIVCEELGVFGVIILLVLFGFLLYRLMFIAQNAPDLYGSLIAVGIFGHIAFQVILNIAVVTNLIPATGITLPFISYGGTSIVFLMAEMGVALGISRTIKFEGD